MLVSTLISLLLTADPSTTAPPAAAPAPVHAPAVDPKKDPNRVICHVENVVGSHRPTRECHTRAEWAEMSDASHQELNNGNGHISKEDANGVGSGFNSPH